MNTYMKQLTTKEKIEYIWDYYKIPIAVTIITIGIIISFAVNWANKVDTNVYCLIFNDSENIALKEHIMTTYSEYIGDDKTTAFVDAGYMFMYLEEHGINWPDEGGVMKYLQLQSSHEADVIIADYESMLWADYKDFLTPVEDILPEELYEQLEPYYVYAIYKDDPSGEGDGIVYGLDISNTEIYNGHSLNYEKAILCFPNVSKDQEAAIRFTKYLYSLPLTEEN